MRISFEILPSNIKGPVFIGLSSETGISVDIISFANVDMDSLFVLLKCLVK